MTIINHGTLNLNFNDGEFEELEIDNLDDLEVEEDEEESKESEEESGAYVRGFCTNTTDENKEDVDAYIQLGKALGLIEKETKKGEPSSVEVDDLVKSIIADLYLELGLERGLIKEVDLKDKEDKG